MRKTRPKIAARGTGPKSRLSCASLRLSPRTKYCFGPRWVAGKGVGRDVVSLSPVDEDTAAATDDGIAGDADHTLGQVEIACVRVGRDRAAKLATGVDDHDLSPVRVAEVVREALADRAAITGRKGWEPCLRPCRRRPARGDRSARAPRRRRRARRPSRPVSSTRLRRKRDLTPFCRNHPPSAVRPPADAATA